MRLAILLCLGVLAAGCGSSGEVGGVRTGALENTAPLAGEVRDAPVILLRSGAGGQAAAMGSGCVTTILDDGTGTSICGDTAEPRPSQLSVVRPGEVLHVQLTYGKVASSSANVRPFFCPVTRAEPVAVNGHTLLAPLQPGLYRLGVFARFEAQDGRSGDVSAAAGLLVDENEPLRVVSILGGDGRCEP